MVLVYPGNLGHEITIIRSFLPDLIIQPLPTPQRVTDLDPVFNTYLSIFGRSSTTFTEQDFSGELEVLGISAEHSARPAAAWCAKVGEGAIYCLPFHLAGAGGFMSTLLDAIRNHRGGASPALPSFLSELRLATETDLLEEIAQHERALVDLGDRARELRKFRMLVGSLSGGPLEELVIAALNSILDGSGYHAEDRQDLHREDFWIVADEAGDFALSESKGVGRHVRRADVNQVDNHRAQFGRDVDDLPGLLIVNTFRNDESFENRVIPVADDVIRQAVRQNVLILRGIDLYHLLSRRLGGKPAAAVFVEALSAGGGWLEVSEERATRHAGRNG